TGGTGTNPEQLFAAGYSACFLGALMYVAGQEIIAIADNASVTGRVGIGAVSTGFAIDVALTISLPGVPAVQAEDLVRKAHIVCP
ncbi:Ohr family peroxiredoxin, partial [Klebsiella variicola]|uniref:Ohr family peroxiredoxin n=1 Tax=Klebsiella variicola TaxID=244366 RepID=UPI0013D3EB16